MAVVRNMLQVFYKYATPYQHLSNPNSSNTSEVVGCMSEISTSFNSHSFAEIIFTLIRCGVWCSPCHMLAHGQSALKKQITPHPTSWAWVEEANQNLENTKLEIWPPLWGPALAENHFCLPGMCCPSLCAWSKSSESLCSAIKPTNSRITILSVSSTSMLPAYMSHNSHRAVE